MAELRRADVPSTLQAELPAAGLGRRIALDIARGLHFLHTHRIVHPPPPLPPAARCQAPRLRGLLLLLVQRRAPPRLH